MSGLMMTPALYDLHKLEAELRESRRGRRHEPCGTANAARPAERTARRRWMTAWIASAAGVS